MKVLSLLILKIDWNETIWLSRDWEETFFSKKYPVAGIWTFFSVINVIYTNFYNSGICQR